MAGLAEVCTHIASISFWLEFTVKIRESMKGKHNRLLHRAGNTQKNWLRSVLHHLHLKSRGLIKVYQIVRLTFCPPVAAVPKIGINILPHYQLIYSIYIQI